MKVAVVGGGPAGLYCALLLKKADPAREVTVFERNPADATYGWGVVFSERTLGELADADPRSARAISDRFVVWDTIDVRYRGEVLRCGGQGFAGIARKALLGLLQRRCDEVGVTLRFGAEITDLAALDDADVIVAADGVHSVARRALADHLRPAVRYGRARYIWYGTDRWLDAFTFIFRESPHGLFQAHAYPFDGTMSTFIVECREETWRTAGLDQADEAASIAFCERLFAPELRGRRLLSNHSRWIRFPTLVTERWWHGNVVLLGDAAHTAHFSIGSGTKLAMEDAIALARAFEGHREPQQAFTEYELGRRPAVEAFQQAARESQTYFEELRRYLYLEPPQFAFHLLTRSGRVSYDSLRVRDGQFVDTVNRWFSLAAGVSSPRPAHDRLVVTAPPMLAPLRLRGLELANRVALALPPDDGAADGTPPAAAVGRAGWLAAAGAGLVLTEPVAVAPDGRATRGAAGFYEERHLVAWARVAAAVHTCPARFGLVLGHAGPRAGMRPRREGLDRPLPEPWVRLAASAVAYAPHVPPPQALTPAEMARIREAFVRAAERAAGAGVDLLVVHAAAGGLLATFVSPLANRRADAYGGPLDARLRFPLEVVQAVRAAWPADRPLAVAFTADDGQTGGLTRGEAVEAAAQFHRAGADLLQPLAGHTTADAHPAYGRGFLTALCDLVRNEARVPVLAGGFLVASDEANTLLAAGRADLCLMHPPEVWTLAD